MDKGGSLPLARTAQALLLTTPSVALSQPMGPKGAALKNPESFSRSHRRPQVFNLYDVGINVGLMSV